jgi:hypothetical protein
MAFSVSPAWAKKPVQGPPHEVPRAAPGSAAQEALDKVMQLPNFPQAALNSPVFRDRTPPSPVEP